MHFYISLLLVRFLASYCVFIFNFSVVAILNKRIVTISYIRETTNKNDRQTDRQTDKECIIGMEFCMLDAVCDARQNVLTYKVNRSSN